MTPTNEERAEWAKTGVLSYAAGKSCTGNPYYDPTDDILTDFLCDLMHYARHENVEFRDCMRKAELHYEAEITEERENHDV